jgi:UDP-glucuronate 4-epimerase
MRICVTGAAGFIGSHVAEALVADGHEVTAVDAFIPYYPRSVKETNLEPIAGDPRYRFVELDLRRDPIEPVLDGVDAVVHLAAMAGLPRSWTDFELYASCNLLAVERLLVAIRHAGIPRLIHVSTSSVYGRDAVGDESTPTRPISPYGVTKLAAEHLVLAHVDSFGLNASILRYFSIYGPRQRPDMAYHRFIEALLDGQPLTLFGDGDQTRSSTYVDDCVRGTVQALAGARPGEIYNIGGGETVTVAEAIGILAETLGVRPRIDRRPARLGDQRHTAADTGKAQAAFAYRPRVAPRDGLLLQLAWQTEARRHHLPAA